jgi:hypothetical protein
MSCATCIALLSQVRAPDRAIGSLHDMPHAITTRRTCNNNVSSAACSAIPQPVRAYEGHDQREEGEGKRHGKREGDAHHGGGHPNSAT